jgi:peroxiredoxin
MAPPQKVAHFLRETNSGDSAKKHAMFKQTYKLTFTLAADEKGRLAKQLGVPNGADVRLCMPDKTFLEFKREVTTARWMFLIGFDSEFVYEHTKVHGGGQQANLGFPRKDDKEKALL